MARFVGFTSRSRKGCLACRRSKKKCTEERPSCALCARRGLACEYAQTSSPEKAKFSMANVRLSASQLRRSQKNPIVFVHPMKTTKKKAKQAQAVEPKAKPRQDDTIDPVLKSPSLPASDPLADDNEDSVDEDIIPPMDESQIIENNNLTAAQLLLQFRNKSLKPYLNPKVHKLFNKSDIDKFITPHKSILSNLDSHGKIFLGHYVSYITYQLGENNKFYLHFVLELAKDNTSVLFLLVSWGAIFLLGEENEESQRYLKMSYDNLSTSDENSIATLIYHCISISMKISIKNVNNWYQHLLNCHQIILNSGGVEKFYTSMDNKLIARWIISTVSYHDILSVRCLDYGPVFDIAEYRKILGNEDNPDLEQEEEDDFALFKDLQSPMYSMTPPEIVSMYSPANKKVSKSSVYKEEYGLDPFLHLSNELFLIMGDMIKARLETRTYSFRNHLISAGTNTSTSSSPANHSPSSFDQETYQRFDNLIDQLVPSPYMIRDIQLNEPDMLESELLLFHLNKMCMKIHLLISFSHYGFDHVKVQYLRNMGIKIFSKLIKGKLHSMLCFSLLILGLTCLENDKPNLLANFEILKERCYIRNIEVTWEIINQVWYQLNELGVEPRVKSGSPQSFDGLAIKNSPAEGDNSYWVDWIEIVNNMGINVCFS